MYYKPRNSTQRRHLPIQAHPIDDISKTSDKNTKLKMSCFFTQSKMGIAWCRLPVHSKHLCSQKLAKLSETSRDWCPFLNWPASLDAAAFPVSLLKHAGNCLHASGKQYLHVSWVIYNAGFDNADDNLLSEWSIGQVWFFYHWVSLCTNFIQMKDYLNYR